jgi:hypothetical protein
VAPGEAGDAGAAITTTAAPGQAQPPSGLSPGDFGVPIYPGAASDPDGLQRTEMGAYYQIHASFETGALPDTVAAFYRAKLKVLAREPGALVETLDPEKTTFALKRDAGHMTFVAIEPREGKPGSDIQLSATGTIDTRKPALNPGIAPPSATRARP